MAPLQYQQAQFQADAFKWPVFSTALMGGRDPGSAPAPALAQPPTNAMDSLAEASASRKRSLDAAAGDAGAEPNGRPADAQSGGESPDAKRSRAAN